jgi:hypothetical protein
MNSSFFFSAEYVKSSRISLLFLGSVAFYYQIMLSVDGKVVSVDEESRLSWLARLRDKGESRQQLMKLLPKS